MVGRRVAYEISAEQALRAVREGESDRGHGLGLQVGLRLSGVVGIGLVVWGQSGACQNGESCDEDHIIIVIS